MRTLTLPTLPDVTPLSWTYVTASVQTESGALWTIINRPSGTVAVRYHAGEEPWCKPSVTVSVDEQHRLTVTDDRGRMVARSTSILSVYVLEN